MNRALYRAMFKQGRMNLVKISAGIVLYEWLLAWVYPLISENAAVSDIVENIPSSVKTVFGVSPQAKTNTFEAFISAQFFARIWAFLMSAYGIETANALLAKLVDDGSLLFVLAAPVSREVIISTQAAVLFSLNAVAVSAAILGALAGAGWFEITVSPWRYIKLGIQAQMFFSVIGNASLLFSVLAGDEEHALACAYGLTFGCYALDVIGGLSDKFAWARRISLFRFFKPQELLEGKQGLSRGLIWLTLLSTILLEAAGRIFSQKDLIL